MPHYSSGEKKAKKSGKHDDGEEITGFLCD
jgi:hypothetical protein